jgi:hypothetical protein
VCLKIIELSNILQLPNTYSIQNSIILIHSLKNTKIDGKGTLFSFDMKNMYTNIPITELKNIIKEILDNDDHTSEHKKHELIILLNSILE